MNCRLIHVIGVREWHRVYWGDSCPDPERKLNSYHNALVHIRDHLGDPRAMDLPSHGLQPDEPLPEGTWPAVCEACNAPVPDRDAGQFQVFRNRLYDTDSGKPEPGDLFWAEYYQRDFNRCVFHDNCDGRHLFAVTPNGRHWDIDGRAANCTLPQDRIHRCWVRHGTPPQITVDKRGHTCAAGGGSIAVPGYHGFLRNGAFT